MESSDISKLIDLYLDGHNVSEISKCLKADKSEIKGYIVELGLNKTAQYLVSKPQEHIYQICCKLFGKANVKQEYYIDTGQRVDVVIPANGIAIEYHGIQHFNFIEFFHRDKAGFEKTLKADEEKEKYCIENGWCYVLFTCYDKLSEDFVTEKIKNAMLSCSDLSSKGRSIKNQFKEDMKERNREYRRKAYRNYKQIKKARKANGN